MSGYFRETSPGSTTTTTSTTPAPGVSVGLCEHTFGSVAPARGLAVLAPLGAAAKLFPLGGGVHEITLTCQEDRYNLGDAEWYAGQKLEALAASGVGEVGWQDNHERSVAFSEAMFKSGAAVVEADRFVTLTLVFLAPASSEAAGFWEVVDEPGEYGGRDSDKDYAAGAVSLGTVGDTMTVEVMRQVRMRQIPRCRGARSGIPHSGAVQRLSVTGFLDARTGDHPSRQIETMIRAIGPGKIDLTGNGNTWGGCVLAGIRPELTDRKGVMFTADFERELS